MNKEFFVKTALTIIAWIVGVMVAFGAVKQDVAVIKATQDAQYQQIQQQLSDIKDQLGRLEFYAERSR